MRCLLLCLLAGGLLLGTGCHSTARYLRKEPDGGVVAIPSDSNHWPSYHRDEANRLMRMVCPNGYTIVEEKEVSVHNEGKPQREYHLTFRSNVQVTLPPAPRGPAEVPASPPPPGLPPRPVPIGP